MDKYFKNKTNKYIALFASGGGNDVASTATENVVVATLTPQRTPADCSYITSPGHVMRALVTGARPDVSLIKAARDAFAAGNF